MNKKVSVYRKEHFCAAHRLNNPSWSEEKNYAVFGKCNNPNYHGHNYEVDVKVTGEPAVDTGFVIDLKYLSDLINETVIEKLDHKNLNLDVDFLHGKIPTAENIAVGIWNQLENKIPSGKLYSVKIYETENNYVEYRGKV